MESDPDGLFEVVRTERGVPAMRDRMSGEVMHPGVGPLVEADALYVVPSRLGVRLQEPISAPLVLLDIGLGAGSNAVAALREAARVARPARTLEVVSFDRTLAPLALATRPEHARAFGFDPALLAAAQALLEAGHHACAQHRWRLRLGDLLDALDAEPSASADIVFWDPFSPRADPSLWGVAAFQRLRRVCRSGATLHTYSAAPATRTALLLAGFYVGLGPHGGRKAKPTTIAATDRAALAAPLDARWLAQLVRSRVPLPFDAPRDALDTLASHPQFRD